MTAAPLIDIAPLERATMPGRVVVQFDKRDVETLKLIKLDLLGLGMLAAIDETIQLIEHDCAVCVDLDRLPEEVPEVFAMLQAADTVGVFQVESRAQMQTLPKSRPACLDDLVVEVAIIRPGPIQGNAVHPYLRRKQGLEPVTYLHPSLEPVLRDSLGVILYQEQVMRVAIDVAGFTPAESDGFRRAMGTWRSTAEMEKLHGRFVDGCVAVQGMSREDSEELYRRVAGFASFGFAKSHAAAFARTAYESSFLKLFYPAQFLVGLVNAQPMGFYPVEVLVNDAKRHGVAVLPVDVNASAYRTTTEWVGRPGWALAGAAGDDGRHDRDPGEPLPPEAGIAARPRPVRSPACVVPTHAARERWTPESTVGWGVRLGLHLVKGIGAEHAAHLDAERARGPYASLADVVERTGLPEEVVERLIRAGALDALGRPRRELLWQLRETARPAKGAPRGGGRVAGRPLDLRLPATTAPDLPPLSELERLGDAYAILSLDARRQVVALFRPALDRLGATTNAALAERQPGPVRLGGLVVTRQHPMTAKGTVFLALEDETGMVNVTLWPDAWARLRGVVRRNALLVVDGILQRESNVVNVVARDVRPLVDEARRAGGPERPDGVRQLGYAGGQALRVTDHAAGQRRNLARHPGRPVSARPRRGARRPSRAARASAKESCSPWPPPGPCTHPFGTRQDADCPARCQRLRAAGVSACGGLPLGCRHVEEPPVEAGKGAHRDPEQRRGDEHVRCVRDLLVGGDDVGEPQRRHQDVGVDGHDNDVGDARQHAQQAAHQPGAARSEHAREERDDHRGWLQDDVPGQHDDLVRGERRDEHRDRRREDQQTRNPAGPRAQDDRRQRPDVPGDVDGTGCRSEGAEEAGARHRGRRRIGRRCGAPVPIAAWDGRGGDGGGLEDVIALAGHAGGCRAVAAAGLGTLGPLGAGHGSSSRCCWWVGAPDGRGRGGAVNATARAWDARGSGAWRAVIDRRRARRGGR